MSQFLPTPLAGVIHITPDFYTDNRGFFMEAYSQREYAKHWIDVSFVQENHSKSAAWVLRGLHFQILQTQSKLVRVVAGSMYDVAVDLRKTSPTYGQYFGVLLSADNKQQLFIPKGFAHGFLSLEDNTEVVYLCDDYYCPEGDGGVIYNDPNIGIDWWKYYDTEQLILSKKDLQHPTFTEFDKNNPF